jgi:DNA-binding NarL/FixJ family response regulator
MELFSSVPQARGTRSFPSLSDRELALLELLARGEDNAAIARQMRLAPKTVRNQISLMLTKMGVADRAAAVAAARDAGLGRDTY